MTRRTIDLYQGTDPVLVIVADDPDLDWASYDVVEFIVKHGEHADEPAGDDVDNRAPALAVRSNVDVDMERDGPTLRIPLCADQLPPPGHYRWRIDTVNDQRRHVAVPPASFIITAV